MASKLDEHKEPRVTRRHAFGIKADVAENIHFIDDSTAAFPIGRNVVLYNTQSNQQRFLQGSEKGEGVTAMALSSNKRYLAIAEAGSPPIVTIYDTVNKRKRKTLPSQGVVLPDIGSREYVCMAFAADGKSLITQGGAPEWTLVYWTWDRSKAVAWTCSAIDKIAAAQDKHHISRVSICPKDPTLICVSGNNVFRFFKLSEGQLKPAPGGMGKREPQNYLSHVWLPPEDRLVVSTESGDLLLVENFEFKTVLQGSPSEGLSIDALIAYAKGFICGGDMGLVFIFERCDDKDMYRKMKAMKVDHKKECDTPIEADSMKVKSFSLTQQEEFLALTTSNNQIYLLNLSNADFSKGEDAVFEPLAQLFHSSPITGLDTCVRKPLVATSSKDRSIKIWNHVDHTLEMSRTFHSEATSIAIHPSGLHILVGFSDKLRFMNLYGDDIREFKSFPIRQCPECRFSTGGQYFAAVHGNIISIYSTYTCESIGHLRGHNGKVRSLFWMPPDDTRLISVGQDGAIFDWSLRDCRKENDCVIKSAHYTSVTAGCATANATASPLAWAVAGDRKLREFDISTLHSGPQHEPDTGDCPLSTITFSPHHKLLLAGSEDGCVYTIPIPLGSTAPGGATTLASQQWDATLAHSGPITRTALTFDESVLFTVGEDCTLYCYDVRDKDGRVAKREITYAEEILISKSDLEDKNDEIGSQRAKVEDLKLDMEYQAQKHDIQHIKEMKTMEDEHREQSERQYQKFEQLLALKNEQELEFTEIRRETAEKHRAELCKLESDYQMQLQASEDQITRLQQETEQQQKSFMNLLMQKEQFLDKTKQEEESAFQAALHAEKEACNQLRTQEKLLKEEHEEMRTMIEVMTDRDIEEIKERYERKLREAREQLLHLKGENGIMKKKFYSLLKDIKDKENEIGNLFESQGEKEGKIKGLEKDIDALRNEIRERDETIGDKEKRIYDLKKKNQELEKFKFVLDYKIKELKSQIEPRQVEIVEAKQKIKAMDGELERYQLNNNQLILTISDLKLKLEGQQKEIGNLQCKIKDSEIFKNRIRTEISELAAIGQEPKLLREASKKLYQKHVKDDVRRTDGEEDLQKENNRQRDYLERTVESLKRKLVKDADTHKADANRIMGENVILIQEINQLRREAKLIRAQNSAKEGQVSDTVRNEIETNKREIARLRSRLAELDRIQHAMGRPAARDKPPDVV
eukprot:TRINITY_DN13707_c0_g1_i1.p1 TRINITY_DN13707_c0_g1~~TRINITY_DN13707_c0_g1_i1.p1  ORF type:complete len:1204 (+),score=482.85 TRINITY_DN13707_c0_g1_i1:137-3748(+)